MINLTYFAITRFICISCRAIK